MKRFHLILLGIAFSPILVILLAILVVFGAWSLLMTHREEQAYRLSPYDPALDPGFAPLPSATDDRDRWTDEHQQRLDRCLSTIDQGE